MVQEECRPMDMASAVSLFLNSPQLVQKENSFIDCVGGLCWVQDICLWAWPVRGLYF